MVITRFFCTDGGVELDVGDNFVEKSTLVQNYPWLNPSMTAGTSLWNWGLNSYGRLGDNTIVTKSSPVQTVSAGTNWRCVSMSYEHIIAIKTDGTLWGWGQGLNGRLGNLSTITRSSPVQTVSATTNWKQASAGECSTASIKTDGTLWVWGGNASGQLGINTIASASSPVQTVSGGTNWTLVCTGERSMAAKKADGTLWTWGRGTEGQLGTNSSIFRSSPVQTVSATTDWTSLSSSGYHVLAIKNNGRIWAWGSGGNGQIGDNLGIAQSSPVQLAAAATTWKSVFAGASKSAAITPQGDLYVWGSNSLGEIGAGSGEVVFRPRLTWFDKPFITVAMGRNGMAGVSVDGSLWIWGSNKNGSTGSNFLNPNNYTYFQSPVQTVAGGNSWRSVAMGYETVVALREEDE